MIKFRTLFLFLFNKDVQTLCSSLTYEMYDPPIFVPRELPSGVLEYAPPVEEFAVHKIDVNLICEKRYLTFMYFSGLGLQSRVHRGRLHFDCGRGLFNNWVAIGFRRRCVIH